MPKYKVVRYVSGREYKIVDVPDDIDNDDDIIDIAFGSDEGWSGYMHTDDIEVYDE